MRLVIIVSLIVLACSFSCRTTSESRTRAVKKSLAFEPPLTRLPRGSALPGKYLGFLRLKDRAVKLPFSIDLISLKPKRDSVKYAMITKLALGSFDGDEYAGQYFASTSFIPNEGAFVIPSNPGQLHFKDVRLRGGNIITGRLFDPDGKHFGDFLSLYAGERRSIQLSSHLPKIFPKHDLVEPLRGTYTGTCDEAQQRLQIETSMWPDLDQKSPTILDNLRLAASWSAQNQTLCADASELCGKSVYTSGRYDLASGKLKLKGQPVDVECQVLGEQLTCGSCLLTRNAPSEDLMASVNRVLERPERQNQLAFPKTKRIPKRPDFPGVVEGEYYGWVLNEKLATYQLMRLKVNGTLTQEPGMRKPTINLGAVATLFYGDETSREFSVYRFEPQFFSESAPNFVFDGPGEALFQVSLWNEDAIRGVWYSKNWGRVGSVELLRGSLPVLPEDARTVRTLSGTYRSTSTRFNLLASADLSRSENDFFPMGLKGIASPIVNPSQRVMVQGAIFDPYTGSIALALEDGRLARGVFDGESLVMSWPERFNFGSAVITQEFEEFRYERDPFSGTTAKQMYDLLNSKAEVSR